LRTPKPLRYGPQSASLAKTSGSPESGEESLDVLIAKVKAMLDGGTPSTFYVASQEPASKSDGSESRLLPSPSGEWQVQTWLGIDFADAEKKIVAHEFRETKQYPIKTMTMCKIAAPDPNPKAKIVFVTDGLGDGVATTLKCANEFYFPKKWVLLEEYHKTNLITLSIPMGGKWRGPVKEANKMLLSGWKLARV
jgi:hypothetical protein